MQPHMQDASRATMIIVEQHYSYISTNVQVASYTVTTMKNNPTIIKNTYSHIHE